MLGAPLLGERLDLYLNGRGAQLLLLVLAEKEILLIRNRVGDNGRGTRDGLLPRSYGVEYL